MDTRAVFVVDFYSSCFTEICNVYQKMKNWQKNRAHFFENKIFQKNKIKYVVNRSCTPIFMFINKNHFWKVQADFWSKKIDI